LQGVIPWANNGWVRFGWYDQSAGTSTGSTGQLEDGQADIPTGTGFAEAIVTPALDTTYHLRVLAQASAGTVDFGDTGNFGSFPSAFIEELANPGASSTASTTSATVTYMPQLMDKDSSQYGFRGQSFIYKNQVYGFGYSTGEAPYGVSNSSITAWTPQVLSAENPPTGWSQVVGSFYNVCALSNVGTVYCAGDYGVGGLGAGTEADRTYLKQISQGAIPNGVTIQKLYSANNYDNAGGAFYVIALGSDGKLYSWGYNSNGQLGDNSTTNRFTPVAVGGTLASKTVSKVSISSASATHVAALATDGTLHTWGYDGAGQLGDGVLGGATHQPAQVATGVADVIARGYSTLAWTTILKTDGTVWSAGDNSEGQLSRGNTIDSSSFVQENTSKTNIAKIFGGGQGTTAMVDNAGYLYLTGQNASYELGDNTQTDRTTYYQPAGAFQGKVDRVLFGGDQAYGYAYTYILDTDGNVWSAGWNGQGQLGRPITTGSFYGGTFQKVFRNTDGKKVVDLKPFGYYETTNETYGGAILLIEDGSLMVAGQNVTGEIPTNTSQTGNYFSFRYVTGFEPGSKQVANGSTVSLSQITAAIGVNTLDHAAFVQEWNWTGVGTQTAFEINTDNLTSGTAFAVNSAGTTTGALASFTLSGAGTTTASALTAAVNNTSSSATALKVSNTGLGLGADIDGRVAFRKGLDYPTGGTTELPFSADTNSSIIRLTSITSMQVLTGIAGGQDGVLLTLMNAGTVGTATIGNQNGSSVAANRIITGTGGDLLLAQDASVLLMYDGSALRWRVIGGSGLGSTTSFTLGTSTTAYMPKLIDEGYKDTQGTVFIYKNQIYVSGVGAAFGINTNANYTPTVLPVENGPSGWNNVIANFTTGCALSNVGTVYCWGNDADGQLGDGAGDSTRYYAKAISFPGSPTITKIYGPSSRGYTNDQATFYAIDSNGKLYAWGDGSQGQIGDGLQADAFAPVQVQNGLFDGSVGNKVVKVSVSGTTMSSGTQAISVLALTDSGKLYGWGGDQGGQLGRNTSATAVLTPQLTFGTATPVVDMVIRGSYHWDGTTNYGIGVFSLAVLSNGTVWGTGANAAGQLGDNSTTDRTFWTQATGVTNAAKVYAAPSNQPRRGESAIVTTTGSVLFAGYNTNGSHGTGDTTQHITFTAPTGSPAFQGKVSKVLLSGYELNSTNATFILDTDGNVWSAGYTGNGLLARNTTTVASNLFGKVTRNTDGMRVVDIALYGIEGQPGVFQGTTILLEDGTLMAAGYNNNGYAGTTVTPITSIANGYRYLLGFEPGSKSGLLTNAVSFNKLAAATGSNSVDMSGYSQILNWSTLSSGTGTALGLVADQLTSGKVFSVSSAGTTTGTLADFTLSGNGTTTAVALSAAITNASSSATALKVSNIGSGLAADVTGAVAFRKGTDFTTGGSTNDAAFSNASLIRLASTSSAQTITGIAGGTDGKLLTLMNAGTVGTATIANQNVGSLAANRIITGTGGDLLLAQDASMLLMYDGSVSRWRVIGGSGSGSVSVASTTTTAVMPQLMDKDSGQYGMRGQVFIYKNQLYAFGVGSSETPYGISTSNLNAWTPQLVTVENPPTGWSQVVGTYYSACALSNVGTVYCWGDNSNNALGDSTSADRNYAKQISQGAIPGGVTITKLYTNNNFDNSSGQSFWALGSDGKLYAWGYNFYGQLGDGSTSSRSTPVLVGASGAMAGKTITKVSVSSSNSTHVAAIDSNGQLYTWGYNGVGQTGNGGVATPQPVPLAISVGTGTAATQIVDVIARGYATVAWTVALRADGQVYSTGDNSTGQLGDGTTTDRSVFTRESTNRTDVAKIFGGAQGSTAMVTNSGTLFLTGYNSRYELGDSSSNANKLAYYQPTGAFQGKVNRVVFGGDQYAGYGYTYILDTDGEIWVSGFDNQGQLGRPVDSGTNVTSFKKPFRNTDGKKVVDIRTYGFYETTDDIWGGAIIMLEDGTLMTTGQNAAGELGSGATNGAGGNIYSFKYVTGFEPGSKQSSTGTTVSLSTLTQAVGVNTIENGSYTQGWNWGSATTETLFALSANNLTSGTLFSASSSGTTTGNLASFTLSGAGTTTAAALYAAVTNTNSQAAALKISNSGAGLAADITGRVAFRKGVDYATPGLTSNAAFGNTSLVRLTGSNPIIDGIANGTDGALLTIMNASGTTATLVNSGTASASTSANQILTGSGQSLVFAADSSVLVQYDATTQKWRVIGGSGSSQVSVPQSASTVYMPQLMDAQNGSQGWMKGTAFIYRNQLYSLGQGNNLYAPYGLNGNNIERAYTPSFVPIAGTAPSGWSQVVGNRDSACALSNVGTVYCWGDNTYGNLGLGDTTARYMATQITSFPAGTVITKLYTNSASYHENWGVYQSFWAIDSTGKVWAWGYNGQGQLGDGTTNQRNSPVQAGSGVLSGKFITKLSIGGNADTTVAAIDSNGQLYTWGFNGVGSLGVGDTTNRSNPTPGTGTMATGVVDVISRGGHDDPDGSSASYTGSHRQSTLVLKSDGTVWGAGSNARGELGVGNTTQQNYFVQSNLSNISKIYLASDNNYSSSGGGNYAFAVDNNGNAWATGYNIYGQLGDGTSNQRTTFYQLTGGFQGKVVKISLTGDIHRGYAFVYILDSDGNVWSSGYNGNGQLGIGGTTNQSTFQKVLRNNDGAKVVDMYNYTFPDGGGVGMLVLDNGALMTTGYNGQGQAGSNVQFYNYNTTFKYVIGFEPGSKGGTGIYSTTVAMNALLAATGSADIDNGNFTQIWRWNSLANSTGLQLLSNSTAAAGNVQTLLNVGLSGANAVGSQTTYAAQISNSHTGTNSSNVALLLSASGGTNNYGLLVSNGNVGFGTVTPTAGVHVGGDGRVRLQQDGSNGVQWDLNAQVGGSFDLSYFLNGVLQSSPLTVGTSGFVGIGTTTPMAANGTSVANLTIQATGNVPGINVMSSDATRYSQIAFSGTNRQYFTGVGNGSETIFGVAGKYYVYDNTAGAMRFVIDNNGNIGIGTNTPGYKLQVRGSVCLDINSDGNCTDTTSAISDSRLKDNVQAMGSSTLDLINRLKPVTFNWKADNEFGLSVGSDKSLGFLAQDMEQVLPELVQQTEEGYKVLDYSKLTALLAAGIQEQQKQISSLTSTLAKLEKVAPKLEGLEVILGSEETLAQRFESIENRLTGLEAKFASLDAALKAAGENGQIQITSFTGGVVADLASTGAIKVLGDIEIGGHILVSVDSAGIVAVAVGTSTVNIKFNKPYAVAPTVTASLSETAGSADWKTLTHRVINVTTDGFSIELSKVAESDVKFMWHAFGQASQSLAEDISKQAGSAAPAAAPASAPATVTTGDGREYGLGSGVAPSGSENTSPPVEVVTPQAPIPATEPTISDTPSTTPAELQPETLTTPLSDTPTNPQTTSDATTPTN